MQILNDSNATTNQNLDETIEPSKIAKCCGTALIKTCKTIHHLYIADEPEDSYIKKNAKYMGRTFFSTVEKIDSKPYLPLTISALALTTGLIANYTETEKQENYNYSSQLIYFGGIGLASSITCSIMNTINKLREFLEPEIEYVIASDKYVAAINKYVSLANHLGELYEQQCVPMRRLLDLMGENHDLLNQLTPDILQARETQIINYDKLKKYNGESLNPETTLSTISLEPLKSLEQPVMYNKQVYEYKNLATWYKIDASCPHSRGELIWDNVLKISK